MCIRLKYIYIYIFFFFISFSCVLEKAHRVWRKGKFSRLERVRGQYTAKTDARRHENEVTLSRYIRVGEAGPYNKPSEVASSLVARLTRVVFASSRRLTLARVRASCRFVVPPVPPSRDQRRSLFIHRR